MCRVLKKERQTSVLVVGTCQRWLSFPLRQAAKIRNIHASRQVLGAWRAQLMQTQLSTAVQNCEGPATPQRAFTNDTRLPTPLVRAQPPPIWDLHPPLGGLQRIHTSCSHEHVSQSYFLLPKHRYETRSSSSRKDDSFLLIL